MHTHLAPIAALALALLVPGIPALAQPPDDGASHEPPSTAPEEGAPSPPTKLKGSFKRLALGASHLRLSSQVDGETTVLAATGFHFPMSIGFQRGFVAYHFDATLDSGPSPKVQSSGGTAQNEDLSLTRYSLGVGATGFLGKRRAWSLFGSASYSFVSLETNEIDSEIVAGAHGFHTRLGAGFDFYRRPKLRLGLVASASAVRYRDAFDGSILAGMAVDGAVSMSFGP